MRNRLFSEDEIHYLMDLLVPPIKPVQVILGFPFQPIVFEVLIYLSNGAFSKRLCFEDSIAFVLVGCLREQNKLQGFIMDHLTLATAHNVSFFGVIRWLLQKT